jgi:hypothetical protein
LKGTVRNLQNLLQKLKDDYLVDMFFCSTNYINKKDQINQTINLILKVIYLIKLDKNFLISCIDNANLRIGQSNSCIKITNDIRGFH